MGNVRDHPTREELARSEGWKRMFAFKDYVDTNCKGCSHIRYCRGGCPYNAIAPTKGEIKGVDPHCPAYKRIFDEITERMNTEMFDSPPIGMQGFASPLSTRKKPGIMALMQKIVMQ